MASPERRRLLDGQPAREKLEQIIRDRPYVAQLIQTQILYDIAGMMEDLVESVAQLQSEFRNSRPVGMVSYIPFAVTDAETILKPKNQPTMPWRSMKIINDGEDSVYVYTSPRREGQFTLEKTPVPPGEDYVVDMRFPIIDEVVFICDKGNSTNIRIIPVV